MAPSVSMGRVFSSPPCAQVAFLRANEAREKEHEVNRYIILEIKDQSRDKFFYLLIDQPYPK